MASGWSYDDYDDSDVEQEEVISGVQEDYYHVPAVFLDDDSEVEQQEVISGVQEDYYHAPAVHSPFVPSSGGWNDVGTASSGRYQNTWKQNSVDKSTGKYSKATVTESYSSGDRVRERGSYGRTGYKDEYKSTSTAKVGDRSGYVEYQRQETVRTVTYPNTSTSCTENNTMRGRENAREEKRTLQASETERTRERTLERRDRERERACF